MSRIKIFSRVLPALKPFDGLQIFEKDGSLSIDIGLHDNINKRPQSRYSQAPPSSHHFKFAKVFDQDAPQEEIFKHVAQNMVDSFLGGYNGTVFAYGQTSSGKTYTIEGSSRSYAERGLIPRTISYVFEDVERRLGLGEDVTVHVTFMEIYQDVGYDLLNPGTRPGALMVTLPKVQVIEGAGGEVAVRNLSVHLAASEEVALSLLFQGSTCRRVAETSMNQHSSRSHTIFTLILTAKSPGKEAIIKSKLHLVDLAGSERVAKTGADGLILQEAKHINLSLHHLEHVIISLQQLTRHKQGTGMSMSRAESTGSPVRTGQARRSHRDGSPNTSRLTTPPSLEHAVGHVPYRNSMLTMVLRDSLGGNCLTSMIATISAEEKNIWESVSTCRFSQRVACISNQARRNEELDDKVVVKRLRKKVAELEAELEASKKEKNSQGIQLSESSRGSLSSEDQKFCHHILNDFFHGRLDNPVHAGINTLPKFQECLFVMRDIVLHAMGIQKQQQTNKTQAGITTMSKEGRECRRLEEAAESSLTTPVNGAGHGGGVLVDSQVSPDSQSRLSSGFGSLQGEGNSEKLSEGWGLRGDMCEGGRELTLLESRGRRAGREPVKSGEDKRELHCRRQAWTNTSQGSPAISTDSRDNSNWYNSHSTASSGSSPMDLSHLHSMPATTNASDTTFSPASPTVQHTSSPYNAMASPSQEQHQTHKYSLLRRSPSTNRRKTSAKRASSTRPDMWTAHEDPPRGRRHVELQQSQEEEQRLQQNLNRANLELQEHEILDDLEVVKEKLAVQHALVKRMERRGTSNSDDVLSEKIVEQQLRVRQAKLQHKLQSIQQELTSHKKQEEMKASISKDSCSLPSSSSSVSRANEPEPVKTRCQRKEERWVEDELERLKMSRKEKELQLREATTRMKIRALKQQLIRTTHPVAIPEPSAAVQAAQKVKASERHSHKLLTDKQSNNDGQIYYLQQANVILSASEEANLKHNAMASSNPHTLNSPTHPQHTVASDVPQHHSETQLHDHMPSTPSTSLPSNGHASSSLPSNRHTSSSLPSNGHTSSSLPSNGHVSSSNGHASSSLLNSPTTSFLHSSHTAPQNNHTHSAPPNGDISSSPSTRDHTLSSYDHAHLHGHISSTASGSNPPVRTTTTESPSHTKVREKLTLPEEIKETEYVTAVQRQKARVNRIRRCMIAATVIQRAWRQHRKHS